MEKKGIPTERGELNRAIKRTNAIMREIKAKIIGLKEWFTGLVTTMKELQADAKQPQSPDLGNLLMRYYSVQREKNRRYSQSQQEQHAADELRTVPKAAILEPKLRSGAETA